MPQSPLAPSAFRHGQLAWLALAAAIALAFWWAPGVYFLGDDFGYVQRFWAMSLSDWPRLFVREWSEGIWGFQLRELRPVSALTFLVEGRLWGGNAAGYHVTNLLLHLACSGTVMLIARELLRPGWIAATSAGLLFALHPVHLEPVVWITGRVDMLGTLGFLLAFYAFLRVRAGGGAVALTAAWLAYAAGVFAKEFCLTLPVVVLFYDLLMPARAGRRTLGALVLPYLGWAAVAGLYYVCRTMAFGHGLGAPVLDLTSKAFWRIVAQRELIYLGQLVWPLNEWLPIGDRQRVAALRALLRLLAAAIVLTGLLWWRDRRTHGAEARTAFFFLVVWCLATTLPFIVTYVSARHLYLASAGLCIGTVALLARCLRQRPVFVAATAVLLVVCAFQVHRMSAAWRAAGEMSRQIAQAIEQVGRRALPGEVLLIDVPGSASGVWVWAWASPFALQPPFQERDLARMLVVLERPDVYRLPERWSAHPSLIRLRSYTGAAWLVASAAGRVTTTSVSMDQFASTRAAVDGAQEPSMWFDAVVTALRTQ